MKIVKLMGGLGNQMFQYAFGQLLGTDVCYDISWFEYTKKSVNVTQRNYELDFFDLNITTLSKKKAKKYKKNNKFLLLFGIKTKIKKIVEIPVNIYNPDLLTINDGVFEGYFQCTQYCDTIREKLLKDFTPKKEISAENQKILNQIKETNSVSLHVRRGDYVKLSQIHGVCDIPYYERAVVYMEKQIKQPHFFLFSDDVDWVKKNLKINSPYTIVNINKGMDSPWDIWLMKHCKHNIIANSSFSWWGAWLNENQNKIVVAPKYWYTDKTSTDIVHPDWKRI